MRRPHAELLRPLGFVGGAAAEDVAIAAHGVVGLGGTRFDQTVAVGVGRAFQPAEGRLVGERQIRGAGFYLRGRIWCKLGVSSKQGGGGAEDTPRTCSSR